VWRQVRAIGPMPAVATIAVPALVVWRTEVVSVGWGLPSLLAPLPILAGAGLIGAGLLVFVRTVAVFAGVGQGTLAPWDPPRRLVIRGPYRYMRHPMITGVFSILLGEAVLLGCPPLLIWAGVFAGANAIYLPLVEEPRLVRRFGEEYEDYKAAVPRWLPRPP
jgi:protein-S-isoprenylcysteine O-methyltransferase Ste14